jgi:hypothetical protein
VQYEFFVVRDMAKKNKSEVKNEDDATPSMVIEQEEDDPLYMGIYWMTSHVAMGSKII